MSSDKSITSSSYYSDSLSSTTMFMELSKVISHLGDSINTLNRDFSSNIKKLINPKTAKGDSQLGFAGIPNSSVLAKNIQNLFHQSNTQFLIPLNNATKLSKLLQDTENKVLSGNNQSKQNSTTISEDIFKSLENAINTNTHQLEKLVIPFQNLQTKGQLELDFGKNIASPVESVHLENSISKVLKPLQSIISANTHQLEKLVMILQRTSPIVEESNKDIMKRPTQLSLWDALSSEIEKKPIEIETPVILTDKIQDQISSISDIFKKVFDSIKQSGFFRQLFSGEIKQYFMNLLPTVRELSKTVSESDEIHNNGFWNGLTSGSFSAAFKGLVHDIKEYKAVVFLTAATTAAFLQETKINAMKVWTDGLEAGSESLSRFQSIVSSVSLQLGADFEQVAFGAGDIRKQVGIAFTDPAFKNLLLLQSKIVTTTGMERGALNELFHSIKLGTKTTEEFNRMTTESGNVLMHLSGKIGITKNDLDLFTKSLGSIHETFIIGRTAQSDMIKGQTQLARSLEGFSEMGISSVWHKMQESMVGILRGDESATQLIHSLGVDILQVQDAFKSGDFTGIFDRLTKSLVEFSDAGGNIALHPNFLYLQRIFGDDMTSKLQVLSANGDLVQGIEKIRTLFNTPMKDNNWNEIVSDFYHSLDKLKGALGHLLALVGTFPVYALTNLFKGLAFVITTVVDQLASLEKFPKMIISGFITLGVGVVTFKALGQSILTVWRILTGVLTTVKATTAATAAMTTAMTVSTAATTAAATASTSAVAGGLLGGGFLVAVRNGLKSLFGGMFGFLKTIVVGGLRLLAISLGALFSPAVIATVIAGTAYAIYTYWDDIVDYFKKTDWNLVWDGFKSGFDTTVSWLKKKWNGTVQYLYDFITSKVPTEQETQLQQRQKYLPQMQSLLPKHVAVPENISDPKQWIKSITALKDLNVSFEGGYEGQNIKIPKLVNKIITAGFGDSFNSFMRQVKGFEKSGGSFELTTDLYRSGFFKILDAAEGKITKEQLSAYLDTIQKESVSGEKIEGKKETVEVEGIDTTNDTLLKILSAIEKLNNNPDSKLPPNPKTKTDRETQSMVFDAVYGYSSTGTPQ